MKGSTGKDFLGLMYRKEGSDQSLGNSSELEIVVINPEKEPESLFLY
jgi:hypothetical protein